MSDDLNAAAAAPIPAIDSKALSTMSHMASLAPPKGRADGPSLTEILQAIPDTENRDAYVRQLVNAEVDRQRFQQDWQMAYQFAMSGQFADLKGQTERQAIATAITKVQMGRSYGLDAADALRFVYFANGRPSIENQIVASKLKDAGYDWDIEWYETEEQHKGQPYMRCTGCRLWLKVRGERGFLPVLDRNGKQVSYAFTEADADHAKIWENGKQVQLSDKWNFKSWPRDMYYWRTVARVHKYHAPNVLRGALAQAEVWDVPLDQQAFDVEPAATLLPEPPEGPAEAPQKRSLKEIALEQARKADE